MAKAENVITRIAEGGIAGDLSAMTITFSTNTGRPLVCRFALATLEAAIGKLSEMVNFVRNQKLSKGDHFEILAVDVAAATAQSHAGGGKVLLSMQTGNGTMYHFAFPPEIVAQILPELQEGEEAARQRAAQTRQ